MEVDRKPVQAAPGLQKALGTMPAGSALVWVYQPGAGACNQYLVLEREARP